MAVIKLNRTKTGVVPTSLADGELYIDQLNGKLYWADAAGAIRNTSLLSVIPSGTKMLFRQSSAPTGWTKDTSLNDAALRVVSGAVADGGSTGFSVAFYGPGVNVGNTTLTAAQIPAHTHTATVTDPGHAHQTYVYNAVAAPYLGAANLAAVAGSPQSFTIGATTGITVANANTGGGEAHTHTNPASGLKYVDVIIATKD